MASLNIPQGWYGLSQDRKGWHNLCHTQVEKKIQQHTKKEDEKRQVRHGTNRHNTDTIFDCQHFYRSFRKSGGLKRHKCTSQNLTQSSLAAASITTMSSSFKCQQCQQSFKQSDDYKRHKCDSVRSRWA